MKVLYIHPAGTFGGASKSLIELFNELKKRNVEGWVITPKGSSVEAFKTAGLKVIETTGLSQFDNTRFSYYRNLRWIILLRELYFFPYTLFSIWKIKRLNVNFDLIHINEITLLPVAIVAKFFFKLPIVCHVRSLQLSSQKNFRSKYVFKLLRKYSDVVICIDETVKQSIPEYIQAYVVHNGINLDGVQIKKQKIRYQSKKIRVGMAGVFLRSKGIYEFVEAAKFLLVERGHDVEFLIAGQNARETKGWLGWIYRRLGFSEDVFFDINKYIIDNKLDKNIKLVGLVKDIRLLYENLDLLCFPSYLNACGRPVFEAAFYEIPSIVAIKNPLEDAIIPGVTGLTIDEPNSKMLAYAIESLIKDRKLHIQLGKQAKIWADKFYRIDVNADKVIEIYKSVKNIKIIKV